MTTDLKLKPHGKRVLVQAIPVPTHVGTLHIPDSAREKRPAEAIVVAIGKGVEDTFPISVGDRVYTARYEGQEVQRGEESYRLLTPDDILAVIDNA